MERIRALDPTLPVLVMTAWSSVAGAVEAMRRGARDYIEKPWDDERLLATVRTQIELRRAVRRNQRLQEANARLQRGAHAGVHRRRRRRSPRSGRPSSASRRPTRRCSSPASTAPARKSSRPGCTRCRDRSGKPLVTMNAGGLAEGIAESELFGHVKGAFTDARFDRIGCFEMADEGTLFLDEIANMPVRLQAKLLRVLQTGEVQRVGSSRLRYVNVRVLSATNADLHGGDRGRAVPRGPALPAEHGGHPPAAAARAARRHRARSRRTSSRIYAARYRKPIAGFDDGGAAALLRARLARATCASWRTASSARC